MPPPSESRGGGSKLAHPELILSLAVISCIGIGFSSWTIGNANTSLGIDVQTGGLEADESIYEIFSQNAAPECFSYFENGMDQDGVVVETGYLIYSINIDIQSAIKANCINSASRTLKFKATLQCTSGQEIFQSSYFPYYSDASLLTLACDDATTTSVGYLTCLNYTSVYSTMGITLTETVFGEESSSFSISYPFTGITSSFVGTSGLSFRLTLEPEVLS